MQNRRVGIVFNDSSRDAPPAYDTDRIIVYPRFRPRFVFVQIQGSELRPGRRFNAATVTLDSRGTSAPDYRFHWDLPGDGDGYDGLSVARIRSWRERGTPVTCPSAAAQWKPRVRVVEFDIPRACINATRGIRVNTRTWDWTTYRNDGSPRAGEFDAVPRARELTRKLG